jgi:hypothetical protein
MIARPGRGPTRSGDEINRERLQVVIVSQRKLASRNRAYGSAQGTRQVNAFIHPKVFPWVCVGWLTITESISAAFDYHYIGPQIIFLAVVTLVPAVLWAAIPVSALVLGVKRLLQHRYRVGIGWLLVPATAAVFAVPANELGDTLLFRLRKPSYDVIAKDVVAGRCSSTERLTWRAEVAFASCTAPVALVIPWGEFTSLWSGIVYDAADEIAKPLPLRSAQWRSTPAGEALDNTYTKSVRSLGNHYYFARGGCCFRDVRDSRVVTQSK